MRENIFLKQDIFFNRTFKKYLNDIPYFFVDEIRGLFFKSEKSFESYNFISIMLIYCINIQ